jgi:hypothetical protein
MCGKIDWNEEPVPIELKRCLALSSPLGCSIGTVQEPIEGVSMMYTFDNSQAESTHTIQYFEIAGNRGI